MANPEKRKKVAYKRAGTDQPLNWPPLKRRPALREITNSGSTRSPIVGDRKPKQENVTQRRKRIVIEKSCGGGCVSSSSVYQQLRSLELDKRLPLADYMEKIQKDVTAHMREILVDWLVEVAEDYNLASDTLFLTVSYIDKYLSCHAVKRAKFQLLGASCMLVASKYEETCPPHVESFCYATDNTFTQDEVENMERDVERLLNYEMSAPTTKIFLRLFTKAAQENSEFSNLEFEFLGSYLAELSLLDYDCVRFLPSVVAASAIFLAIFTLRPTKHPWTFALQRCSGYRPSSLKECILTIHELQLGRRRSKTKALRQKYMHLKFEQVALLSSPQEVPTCYFDDI